MKRLLAMLPPSVQRAVSAYGTKNLAEIHLRRERRTSLTYYDASGGMTRPLPIHLSAEEMQACLAALCGGSVYAHTESLREGFLSLAGGVRVGVSGRAVTKDGHITAVAEVSSIVLRLPHTACGAADMLVAHMRRSHKGLLVYGPPGCGKTTLLRELLRELSGGARPWRCAVIDARGELGIEGADCCLDVLSGYPKDKGVEIAVRTLTPELVVLDEIGAEEARGLLSVANMGVITVASAHGNCAEDLLARPPLLALLRTGMFGYLYRVGGGAPVPCARVIGSPDPHPLTEGVCE